MRVAIVHDYIKEMGGAERVLFALAKMFPRAPIYTAFVARESMVAQSLGQQRIFESRWGWLLKRGKLYSYLRFCLPWIWRSVDLRDYDLVITSCSGYVARGFLVRDEAKVVAYCHTPPRWLYGYETPTGAQETWWGKMYLWLFGPMVRYFDFVSAQRVNVFVANSFEVARRIKKFYRKEAKVVYPPCEVKVRRSKKKNGKYWLLVSRIVGGKGIERAIELAKKTGEKLVIVGTGPLMAKLQKETQDERNGQGGSVGKGKVVWKGYVPDEKMAKIYAGAKGFLALAHDEDFGMAVVEAMAYGVPVLAFDGGGYRETVLNGVNGRLAREEEMVEVMRSWEQNKFVASKISRSVKKFGRERFLREIKKIIKEC